jgi:hypothetical protein
MKVNTRDSRLARSFARQAMLALPILFAVTTAAFAQGNRVCLYERPNYGGKVVCIDSGDDIDNLQRLTGGWSDRMGSIRLIGTAHATIFENAGFAGRSYRVETDIPNLNQLQGNELRGWRALASSIRVSGRGDSRQGQDNSRACLYSQPNFNGQSVCFNLGEDSADLRRNRGGWNGRVGSIRLSGNAQVTIFEENAYAGASFVISDDVPDFAQLRNNQLRGWRREPSSLRVDTRRSDTRRSQGSRPDNPAGDRVCLYDQPNYAGQSTCFGVGENSSDLNLSAGGWNDRAASIRMFGSVEATIYEHVAFGGASYVVSADIQNLSQVRLGQTRGNFRQQVSSIRVERPASAARSSETERIASLNGAYTGTGELRIGNRVQQLNDLLVRLRSGGGARIEIPINGQRTTLIGNWSEGNRGQIDIRISGGLDNSGASGQGTLYQRRGVFERLELTGQTNRQQFSLSFRDDDSFWSGGGWAPGGGRNTAPPTGTTVYRGAILSVLSGKGLDVADMSTLDGANVQQWEYNRQPNQTWQIVDLGNSEVAIIAVHSNKALTVQGGRDLNGANIVQREWRNNPFQRWRLEPVAGGAYRIINVGSGKALDVAAQSREDGATIQQWDYANQQNQQWRLQR